MTNRERLERIYRGDLPDRPAVKLWGLIPEQKLLHPAHEPVYRAAMERTDLVFGADSAFDLHWGSGKDEICKTHEVPTASGEWVEVVTEMRTPGGDLRSAVRRSTVGKPGYRKEALLKEPEDIRKILAVPYLPYPFSPDAYLSTERTEGDRGVTMFGLSHAMYGLQQLIGSGNFAVWSVECRDLLLEAVEVYAGRIREQVIRAFDAGLRPIFAWVGPELCIPPLMSPGDFDEFVYRFDAPLCDLIHERGGAVWVHCHGKMGPVLERFVDIGVDVLNPVEPPPMGDVMLDEAFERVDGRMGLEGNIETHDLMAANEERMRHIVGEALAAGKGKRFILCPTSGYMETPFPEDRLIRNLMIYIEEGVRWAEQQKK